MTSTNQSPQKSPITIQFISPINIAQHTIYVNRDKKTNQFTNNKTN